ncbi:MAG: thiamine-phosphate kinase [Gammaproteobacteria bacterium]|nr:thiamine-phosphate kinase [Gammaproteobacteria bacterium]
MNEFELIDRLQQRNRVTRTDVVAGIGDDCARVTIPAGFELAITTDTLIDGVHFPKGTSAHAIGYKALAVNLSDLAAMGAEPAWVTLALTMPEADTNWLDQFAEGFYSLAEQYQVCLIGGDTTRGPLSVTIQAHGFIPENKALLRSGAKAGDYICVTGTLGDAGLELMKLAGTSPTVSGVNRLNYPLPRIEAGIALRDIASSAIDISDGLIADLGHILQASQVGARLTLEEIPLSSSLLEDQDPGMMLQLALTAGDDYELCFTIPEQQIEAVNQLQYQLNLPIKHIGNIEKELGLRIHRQDGRPLEIANDGYNHFSRKQELDQ